MAEIPEDVIKECLSNDPVTVSGYLGSSGFSFHPDGSADGYSISFELHQWRKGNGNKESTSLLVEIIKPAAMVDVEDLAEDGTLLILNGYLLTGNSVEIPHLFVCGIEDISAADESSVNDVISINIDGTGDILFNKKTSAFERVISWGREMLLLSVYVDDDSNIPPVIDKVKSLIHDHRELDRRVKSHASDLLLNENCAPRLPEAMKRLTKEQLVKRITLKNLVVTDESDGSVQYCLIAGRAPHEIRILIKYNFMNELIARELV